MGTVYDFAGMIIIGKVRIQPLLVVAVTITAILIRFPTTETHIKSAPTRSDDRAWVTGGAPLDLVAIVPSKSKSSGFSREGDHQKADFSLSCTTNAAKSPHRTLADREQQSTCFSATNLRVTLCSWLI